MSFKQRLFLNVMKSAVVRWPLGGHSQRMSSWAWEST